jgi:hypothetical protein
MAMALQLPVRVNRKAAVGLRKPRLDAENRQLKFVENSPYFFHTTTRSVFYIQRIERAFAKGVRQMEMALGRQRTLVLKVAHRASNCVYDPDAAEQLYLRRELQHQLKRERIYHDQLAAHVVMTWRGIR